MSIGSLITSRFCDEEIDLNTETRARLILIINRVYQAGLDQGIDEWKRRIEISDEVMAAIQGDAQ